MSQGEHESEHAVDSALEPELRQLLLGEAARFDGEANVEDRAAARQVVKRFRGRERRRRITMAAATALSLAAAVTLTLRLRAANGAGETATRVAVPANTSRYALQSGTASTLAGHALALGQPLDAGAVVLGPNACVASPAGRLCARTPLGAVVALPLPAAPQAVVLTRGGVSVELFAADSGVSLATIHGGVVALTSALFTLELDSTGAFTAVTVQNGSVRYHDLQGVQAALFAAQSARLPAAPASDAPSNVPAEAPDVAPAPAVVHAAPPSSAPRASSGSSGSSGSSASELLELARQERAQRHYSAAALAYRKLEQTFPGSAEARAALVSLGQLQLGQLGQPAAALRSFQAYLAAPGQLQQEAEHGSILALQKLGRKAEERRAIDAFLARYPKSVQAGALKERLKQL